MPVNNRPVYISGIGRIPVCRRCGEPQEACRCAHKQEPSASRPGLVRDGWVRVSRERKGRGGKVVTLVSGLPQDPEVLAQISQTLKRHCATGGTVEGELVVLQGDHRDRLEPKLIAMGYKVKRVGA